MPFCFPGFFSAEDGVRLGGVFLGGVLLGNGAAAAGFSGSARGGLAPGGGPFGGGLHGWPALSTHTTSVTSSPLSLMVVRSSFRLLSSGAPTTAGAAAASGASTRAFFAGLSSK